MGVRGAVAPRGVVSFYGGLSTGSGPLSIVCSASASTSARSNRQQQPLHGHITAHCMAPSSLPHPMLPATPRRPSSPCCPCALPTPSSPPPATLLLPGASQPAPSSNSSSRRRSSGKPAPAWMAAATAAARVTGPAPACPAAAPRPTLPPVLPPLPLLPSLPGAGACCAATSCTTCWVCSSFWAPCSSSGASTPARSTFG